MSFSCFIYSVVWQVEIMKRFQDKKFHLFSLWSLFVVSWFWYLPITSLFCIPLSWCTKFRRLMVPAKSTNIVMQRIQIHSQYTVLPLMYISYDSDRLFLNTDHNYFNCIVLVVGRWHDNGVIDPCRGCLISLSQCYLFYLKKKKKQT